jgi:hypothetical protein
LDKSVLQIKTKIVSFDAAESKPVKQEVNGTTILPPLAFPVITIGPYFKEGRYCIVCGLVYQFPI